MQYEQNLRTFMWIYMRSLLHYVKWTQTRTTVASLTGGNQEWKKCLGFSYFP